MFSRYYFFLICLCVLLPTAIIHGSSVLSVDQEHWLAQKNNTILVRPERNRPPFDFFSSQMSTHPKGLVIDYIELIAKKVNAKLTYLEAKPLSVQLTDVQNGKEGVLLGITPTIEGEKYLYFSESFIDIPAVIVTRKDSQFRKENLSLGDFSGKQIAVGESYAVAEYLIENYPRIILEPVTDDEVSLQKLLLGEVDAAVMDLASLSYYTSQDMLSYVRISGQTGFVYHLAFAVPKTTPELLPIINAGLREITPAERDIIRDRWITFLDKESSTNRNIIFGLSPILVIGGVLFALLVLILLVIITVRLGKRHSFPMVSGFKKKKEKLLELKAELSDLRDANEAVTENLEEIQMLEHQIEEKIKDIS